MNGHRVSWASTLEQFSINGSHFSAEEVVDVCLLLTLSGRVRVLSFDPDAVAPCQLSRQLHRLGHPACTVFDDALTGLAAQDTVVAFVGPKPSEALSRLRSVTVSGAVLIVITTRNASPIDELADAVVIVPSIASTMSGPLQRFAFDLLASMVVEAIGRELTARVQRDVAAVISDDAFSDSPPCCPTCLRNQQLTRRH